MERENSKEHIDVSVIIVNYNSFGLLVNCLTSLITYTKDIIYEIIIIDNNSTSGNIKEILNEFENLRIIQNSDNRGFGSANNQGLEIAKGKYVLFLNNDTILFENTIKKVFNFSESINLPTIIGCKLLNKDKSLQHSVFDFPSVLNVFTSNFFLHALFPKYKFFNKYYLMNKKINKTTLVDVVTGAFLFSRRDEIQKLGGFDDRFFFYNEETDLCYQFVQSGGKVYYFPETAIIHLKGGTAKKTSWFAYKNQSISTIKFFQKHFNNSNFLSAVLIHYVGLFMRIPIFLLIGMMTLNGELIKRSFYSFRLLFVYPTNSFKN